MKLTKKSIVIKKNAAPIACSVDDLAALKVPAPMQREIKRLLKKQAVVFLPTFARMPVAYLLVGRKINWSSNNAVRKQFGQLAMTAQAQQLSQVQLYIGEQTAELSGIAVQGFCQGAYRFDVYLSNKTNHLKQVHVDTSLSAQALRKQALLAEAITQCRDLINTPAEDMGPDHFVSAARKILRGSGVRMRVMDAAACKRAGMGALLAVGRASPRKPRLLILEAGPKRKNFHALCGKGVCFDTGGLGIKPSKGMLLMRKDMGGAATVLSAISAAARLGLKQAVRVYIPLVENNIDGSAFRPGDILTSMDGTTIEIGHTDAEGRLILADAIGQARKEGAASICTVATLTGAAMVALGRIHVPIMGDDEKQIAKLEQAAAVCGEKVWRLPLEDEHRHIMNTPHADINNSGNGEAGCITAGAFLQHFAHGTPFMHCDISPCSWQVKDHELGQVGATGVLVDSLSKLF